MRKLLVIICFFMIFSCKKKREANYDINVVACGVNNPIKNLPWLAKQFKDMANYPEMNGIVLYTYEGKQIIDIYKSYYSSVYGRQYWCDGTEIVFSSQAEFKDYIDKRQRIAVVFGQKFGLDE